MILPIVLTSELRVTRSRKIPKWNLSNAVPYITSDSTYASNLPPFTRPAFDEKNPREPFSNISGIVSPTPLVTETSSAPAPVPPGLSSAQEFPPLAIPAQSQVATAPKFQRKVATRVGNSAIKPVIPVLPGASAPKAAAAIGQRVNDELSSKGKDRELQEPALPEPLNESNTARSMSENVGKREAEFSNKMPASANSTQTSGTMEKFENRGRPEKLKLNDVQDISKLGGENIATEHTFSEPGADANALHTTPSQPTTPATAPSYESAPSSIRKSHAKTIRLTGTPKTEIPSPGTAPSQGSGQASRRPSLTSLNRPETPVSERISDTVSYTSASMSRANSPPSNKIGSSTRHVTKNQQKKDRQERAKKAESEAVRKEEPAPKVEEDVVQAPIIGRKKKTKKPKERKANTADSTPAVTRPASPESLESITKEDTAPPMPIDQVKSIKEGKKPIKIPPVAPVEFESAQSIAATPAVVETNRGTPAQYTASEIFAHLQASNEIPQSAVETLFKPITGASHRVDQNLDPEHILGGHQGALKPNQVAQLRNDEPIVIVTNKNNAFIVFPNRRCLKGLTPAQANRYKELYLRGHRAMVPPLNTERQEANDRLMPRYQSWAEGPRLAAADASSQPEQQASTAQLTNRFATNNNAPPQDLFSSSSAPLSSVLSSDNPPVLPASQLGHDGLMYHHQAEKRVMELEEAEVALAAERKNTEGLEKRLNALIRKNRRLVLGSGN